MSREQTPRDIASFILSKSADKHVLLGPLITEMLNGTKPEIPYVMICTGDEEKQFHCDQIFCHDAAGRATIARALARPRVVLHDFDDECEMAKWAEALWPCEKIRKIRRNLAAEHNAQV